MDRCRERDLEEERDRLRSEYLDLMCNSLIGCLNQDPPLAAESPVYDETSRENGWDWPSGAPSMIGAKRMRHLRDECERVIREGVPGDFIETGIWRGGACMMMRAVLKAYAITDRRVFGADTFAGLPPPSPDVEADADAYLHECDEFSISLKEVKAAFFRYGLLDSQVVFLEGLFKDTLPSAPVEKLSVLRLDADMYESTMDGLTNLYDKLSPGGSLIADDYFLFDAHRKAVDEYRAAHGIADPIAQIDDYGGYWVKDSGHALPR